MSHYLNKNTKNQIKQADALLRQGELVVFPTETVYGLGADAANDMAVERIYAIKKRPRNHPLIVHIANIADISNWATDINQTAWQLAKIFWPGPLTLVLKRAPHVLSSVTGGHDTIAIRIPSHPVAQSLLQLFGGGIAAPSANYFGKLSPTQASHVNKDLGMDVKLVIDGGRCQCGLESTIVDVTGDFPNILRLGAINAESIAAAIGQQIGVAQSNKIAVPGALAAHYAPHTRLHLISSEKLKEFIEQLLIKHKTVAVLAQQSAFLEHPNIKWITMPNTSSAYAYELYMRLHEADEIKHDAIVVEIPPNDNDWLALHDRLKKAEQGSKNLTEN